MKVILLQELKGKGGEGDVIDVAAGFANNYLLKKGFAVPATKGNLKQLEQRKHNIAKREEGRLASANSLKETLDGATVNIVAQVGEAGQLFGSVTAQMIADALKEAFDIEVDKRRVELKNPIKVAGEHSVAVSIYRETKAMLKVLVGSAEDLAAQEEVVSEESAEEVPEEAAVVAEAEEIVAEAENEEALTEEDVPSK